MLQIAISAAFMVGIFKLFESKNKKYDLVEVDWWVGAAVVAVPAFIVFFLSAALAEKLGILLLPIALAIYFFVPFFYFKSMLEYPAKMAALYSVFVPVIVFTIEVVFMVIFGSTKG